MKISTILVLGMIFFLNSCSDHKNRGLQKLSTDEYPVHMIKFQEVKDTITLNLSDLFNNVSFVKLETTEENKLTRGKWTIGDNYIIGYIRGLGLYQFTANGNFIRKLINYGKGPHEVNNPVWTISEDERFIYIFDSLKPKNFLCFNLHSGKYEKDIPIALEGLLRNFELVNDSILICAPITGTGKPAGEYYLFWQSLSGKLLNKVLVRTSVSKVIVPNENLIYRIGDQFHYRPLFSDTIFNVTDFNFEPYLILDANKPENIPEYEVGSINIKILLEASNFIIIETNKIIAKEMIGEKAFRYPSIRNYYYFDKLKMKTFKITNFINDIFGFEEDPMTFEDQSSQIKYIYIEPLSLLRRINRLKMDPKIIVADREKILKLENGTTEDDNPILITLENK